MFWIFMNLVSRWRLTKKSKQIGYLGVQRVLLTATLSTAEIAETFAEIDAACTPFPEPTKTMSISCGFENKYKKVIKVQDHC